MLNWIDIRGGSGVVADMLPKSSYATEASLASVRAIIKDVRERGDVALAEYTERFDKVTVASLAVEPDQIAAAAERVRASSLDVHEAIAVSVANVEAYHRHQIPVNVSHVSPGLRIEELHRPVSRAGCYVPGGRAVYPSTVIMTAVPAKVAGVKEIALVVPPDSDGSVPDVTLAAAYASGVHEVYAVGGAQAVAALAYGTDTIPSVDVIVGPGNIWVASAQREVAGVVGVPSAFAGPSEVVVVADDTANPTFVAADMILQSEHGPDGLAWMVTWDERIAKSVEREIERLASSAKRRSEIMSTLQTNGYIVLCADVEQAVEVVNSVAPEHLEIMVANTESVLRGVRNAGAVFCGSWAPASLGDYVAGPNHVLPTNGSARFASALGVRDFYKSMHVVHVESEGMQALAPHVVALATAEGLTAHADSVRLRLAEID